MTEQPQPEKLTLGEAAQHARDAVERAEKRRDDAAQAEAQTNQTPQARWQAIGNQIGLNQDGRFHLHFEAATYEESQLAVDILNALEARLDEASKGMSLLAGEIASLRDSERRLKTAVQAAQAEARPDQTPPARWRVVGDRIVRNRADGQLPGAEDDIRIGDMAQWLADYLNALEDRLREAEAKFESMLHVAQEEYTKYAVEIGNERERHAASEDRLRVSEQISEARRLDLNRALEASSIAESGRLAAEARATVAEALVDQLDDLREAAEAGRTAAEATVGELASSRTYLLAEARRILAERDKLRRERDKLQAMFLTGGPEHDPVRIEADNVALRQQLEALRTFAERAVVYTSNQSGHTLGCQCPEGQCANRRAVLAATEALREEPGR